MSARTNFQRAGLLLAGIVAALAAGEMLVRALGAAPNVAWLRREEVQISANPLIGWEPAVRATTDGGANAPADGRNSLGFRDDEHAVSRAQGVRRILVLGDSIVKGLGVPEREHIVTSVMQRRLEQSGVRA